MVMIVMNILGITRKIKAMYYIILLSYLNHVWIFIWIMYFKMFEYLYCLFHFYFNYVILLFTTWLELSIYN